MPQRKSRLREPSTYAGLAGIGQLLAQLAPLFLPPEYVGLAVILGHAITGAGGGAAIVMRDAPRGQVEAP